MARKFSPGNSDYLIHGAAVKAAAPFTIACWVKLDQLPSTLGDEMTAFCLGRADFSQQNWSFLRADDGDDALYWYVRGDGTLAASSTTADVTAGVWEHWCGVEIASNSRAVYLNGANKGTNDTEAVPLAIDRTLIGAQTSASIHDFMDGAIAWPAKWNVALTDAEVAALATGIHPQMMRPEDILAFWPLGGFDGEHDKDVFGNYDMTAQGAPTWVDHHGGLTYPSSPLAVTPPTGAPPAVVASPYYYESLLQGAS